MRTRRQEPPGRGGGDKGRPRRDGGAPGPGKREPSPRSDKPPRQRGKPGGPSGPGRGSTGRSGGGPPRGPRRREEERLLPESPILARTGRELLYGRNAVLEALRGRRGVERLFIAEGVREDDRLRAIVALAGERGAEIDRVPRMMLDDALRGANHQGVALEAEAHHAIPFEDLIAIPGTILVLDHLQDPQNVGTLLRAAEAAGVAGVVLPQDRAAEVTPAVVNASAGAVEHLRMATVPNLARALDTLKRSGRWVVGLDAGAGSADLFTTEIPRPAVLVVGAEGGGLGAHLRKSCDLLLALPMLGRVASLNAATAGAIALYELVRRDALAANPASGEP